MPRSTKAAQKSSTVQKRTTKRSASRSTKCYEIPESPPSHDQLAHGDQIEDCAVPRASTESTHSPIPTYRGRSVSSASSTVHELDDATPTQSTTIRSRVTSIEPKQLSLPGFEALEAVNELYQKLKDSQTEIDRLREETEKLRLQETKQLTRIRYLEADLRTEKEKVKKIQQVRENESDTVRKNAEERLRDVVGSLKNFSSAALKIMPLLDVLTGAADIEYDDATEKLYQIIKEHKQERNTSALKVKKESTDQVAVP